MIFISTVVAALICTALASTCPPQPPCPGQCAVGRDENGCMTCECAKPQPQPDSGPSCSIWFRPPCPLKCSLAHSPNGCQQCICPDGVNPNDPECDDSKKCLDPNGECIGIYCFCKSGYDRANNGCVKRPQLGEPCLINGTYISCIGYGVNVNCDRNSSNPKCLCMDGFEANGDTKQCKPTARKLGEKCKTDSDCATAYTYCTNGTCKCIDGFTENGIICTPKNYNCPSGKADKDGHVVLCDLKYNATSYLFDIDSCPKDYFCFTTPNVFSKDRGYAGHCCPKVKPGEKVAKVCPVGNVHPTSKCPDNSQPVDAPLLPQFQPFCPMDTHECIALQCCPIPCRRNITGFFSVDNFCYDHVTLNQECQVGAQCNPDAECVQAKGQKERKTCQCKLGFKAKDQLFCDKENS